MTLGSYHFGLPALACSSTWAAQMRLIASWAIASASRMTSSAICLAPASTIVIASGEPQTIRSRLEVSISGSVGLSTSSPSMRPTRTAATGPRKGSGDSISAAEAPLIASTSCAATKSAESTVPMICTSLRNPLGQSGRIGRSTMRALRVARLGRLALALEEAAGDLARGVHLLLDVDGEGEEVDPFPRLRTTDGGREYSRLAARDEDRSVRLLGESAGGERDVVLADRDGHGLLGLGSGSHVVPFLTRAPLRGHLRKNDEPGAAYRRSPSSKISARYDSRFVRWR